jgi:hypothetical protein
MTLAAIGAEGQAKIASAEVVVARGFAGQVQAKYLRAAGVGKVVGGDLEIVDVRFDDLDPAVRELALGAHAAVMAIKNVL